uniref:PRA1 family protein n=1 Tax=Mantoniella antarctica TaxID=81844 RepID=A0A7S0T494_9CHLO|mmetsp:Transcript_9211/g.22664  ORF Transcript_9211/g.22664 Transcript_9211/m.22664 type:complete len:190 (+) Transcript_9211:64-633(+)
MAEAVAATSPLMAALTKIKDSALHVVSQRKPMTEILDRTAYQRPGSFSEATGRMQKNLNYFKINYVLLTAAVLSAFILYHPWSIVWLSAIGSAWTYVYLVRTEPLKIGERPVSEREKVLGMSGISLLIVFFMSSVGSVILSGFGVALLAIGAHSAVRVPDDLFIDDSANDNGFFSFLSPPRPGLTGSVA